jgi:hypothetical protein
VALEEGRVTPRRRRCALALTIRYRVDKAALTVVEIVLIGKGAVDAQSSALVDGILTVLLAAAYLLSRGYASWWGGAATAK